MAVFEQNFIYKKRQWARFGQWVSLLNLDLDHVVVYTMVYTSNNIYEAQSPWLNLENEIYNLLYTISAF